MAKTILKVFIFLLVVLGTFMWIGQSITAMTGGEKKASAEVEVSPEQVTGHTRPCPTTVTNADGVGRSR